MEFTIRKLPCSAEGYSKPPTTLRQVLVAFNEMHPRIDIFHPAELPYL